MNVFLAEDDPALREQLTAVINEVCDAHVVASAETESEAVDWLRVHRSQWELAVLDLFLKKGTGFGILEKLPPASQRDAVIVLTNSATPENRARCLALGACAVYDKSRELDQFLDHCLRHGSQPGGCRG